ncbi:MAG: aspartate carbamoyltransferase catalytic subunit [bacterium]|nr:aspartate carbamoyltransferase catalytic subunit [bacterium]
MNEVVDVRLKVFGRKDLLGLQDLHPDEIRLILDTARSFREISERPIKKVPTLRGKTLVNLFYEPSTRTRTSFEIAAKRLSADIININVPQSSIVKGEGLKDTVKTIEAMEASIVVIRHGQAGVPHILAHMVKSSIINAGDGAHEHPTQGLIDMFTILEKKGSLEGLRIVIVGDILHSRVARSNIFGLTKMGAKVCVCGPPTLIPPKVEQLKVEVYYKLEEAIKDADVIMLLRMQLERQCPNLFPTLLEYTKLYGLNKERLRVASQDVLVMHPGPINRGIEITPDVADSHYSVICDQVRNGIAVRMTVLYLLSGNRGRL